MKLQNERLLLLILAAIQFCTTLDFVIILPLGPQYMRLMHLDPAQFSRIVYAYAVAAGNLSVGGIGASGAWWPNDLTHFSAAKQQQVADLFREPDAWARKAILNVAGSGKFSSDRTIAEYAADIWKVKPCPVE